MPLSWCVLLACALAGWLPSVCNKREGFGHHRGRYGMVTAIADDEGHLCSFHKSNSQNLKRRRPPPSQRSAPRPSLAATSRVEHTPCAQVGVVVDAPIDRSVIPQRKDRGEREIECIEQRVEDLHRLMIMSGRGRRTRALLSLTMEPPFGCSWVTRINRKNVRVKRLDPPMSAFLPYW